MENLILKPGKFNGRKAAGVFWILYAIIRLIIVKDPLDNSDWMISIAFCLIGVISFTPLAGSHKSQIEICDGCLKIIWTGWIRKVTVPESEIESIVLAKNGVMIKRKDKRPLKIKFYLNEKEHKDQIYNFFIEYAHLKNFVQEKQYSQI
jgi:uncharacterized membrane protein YobD (UPF0266 family)